MGEIINPRTTTDILLDKIRQNTADLEINLGDVDVNLEALETINTAIKTAVETIDNAISGTEMQVDIVASLPAGTNAIGKLAANSGVDIGDVDVTSIVPGTGATNLGKAEDAAHSSGDVGVMPLGVRNDDLATLGGADGDYSPLQVNATGALYTTSSIGQLGAILVNDTTAVVCGITGGTFVAIYMLTDTVFNGSAGGLTSSISQTFLDDTETSTAVDGDAGTAIDGITFPAGMTLYGRYDGFTLASGSVIAYVG